MKTIIVIQSLMIIYLCTLVPNGQTGYKAYNGLLLELKSVRDYNYQICFSKAEIRGQDEYCWAYNVLDLVLHERGLK